ncbi:MFS general substrate transporter [Saccharata proteae CBS 121410]|uniref:MFS general substrate transporter n=1 Tax=Saccharata proteae CBS 121410 TaxID=1314787 RepID=A0A9P4HPK9_9PEZI|nr:MFS general substrate transporter [Saccharata proteae CBS 121410]
MDRARGILSRLNTEVGLKTIWKAPKDVHILFLARFLRMFAYGSVALILALYFSDLSISDERIGLFMTLTLLGDVAVSLLLTLVADSLGRRRILLFGSLCMALSGVIFALFGNYWILLLGAVIGVISPSGNEIGPFRAVEESTLAHLTDSEGRSDVFAWYVVLGTIGTAAGSITCGWMVEGLTKRSGWGELDAYRIVFWLYAGIGVMKALLTWTLSVRCEVEDRKQEPQQREEEEREQYEGLLHEDDDETEDQTKPPPPPSKPKSKNAFAQLSWQTRWTLLKLCALFAIDSLASGMVPYSLINFFMDRKFHLPKSTLGTIVSVTWFISSISNIFSSAISKRIGLIKTMVFTHLPSAIFLMLLPAPRGLVLTIMLLVGRGALASMDQAPRSAFLSAVVLPEERTAVMGIVNVVKTLSQSGGPTVTGVLAGKDKFWIAFVVAGALKASYDLGMLAFFVNTRLHERGKGLKRPEEEELDEFEVASDVGEVDGKDESKKPLGTGKSIA